MTDADSFLHLARPLGPVVVGNQPVTGPLNVVVQPQVSPAAILIVVNLC